MTRENMSLFNVNLASAYTTSIWIGSFSPTIPTILYHTKIPTLTKISRTLMSPDYDHAEPHVDIDTHDRPTQPDFCRYA